MVDPLKYMCEMRQDRGGIIQTPVRLNILHSLTPSLLYHVMYTSNYDRLLGSLAVTFALFSAPCDDDSSTEYWYNYDRPR